MALTKEQLQLLDACPILSAFKDWFIAVDETLDSETETEPAPETDATEPEGDG